MAMPRSVMIRHAGLSELSVGSYLSFLSGTRCVQLCSPHDPGSNVAIHSVEGQPHKGSVPQEPPRPPSLQEQH